MATLILLWLAAIFAVPAFALLLRAWFGSGRWLRFDLLTYFIAWAIVGLSEMFGIIWLTGEPISVMIAGFWSTLGAAVVGFVWWLATKIEQAER